jgi:amidase
LSARLDDIRFGDARGLAARLRSRELSAVDVMDACLAQIERLNPIVNAIPTLRPREELLEEARAADARLARGDTVGPLHALPFAIKDVSLTRGLRTTFGSRIYRNFVPTSDELYVERIKRAGGIVIGKTNTPEFGAGSQTFNALFGATRNPYDLSKTCGGSSGGAAVALACGMVPLADGTDLGGSLRNPASFCNVVGFRPSPGRVPRLHSPATDTLGVNGPMARNVADVAMLLAAIAGPDGRDPLSLADPGSAFAPPLERSFRGARIAWSERLGWYPVEPVITAVCNGMRPALADLGCDVADAEPDLAGADEIFQTLRAASYASTLGRELERNRALLKDTVIWNIEQGLALRADAVERAWTEKAALEQRVDRFFERYEFLVLPVSQVAPFPIEVEWVHEIDGVPMQTYIDWMATCYAITCTGLPAMSLPAGFTPNGLPVGLQLVGRRGSDREVLELGHALENVTRFGSRRPPIVG